jgi:hypothetical protein
MPVYPEIGAGGKRNDVEGLHFTRGAMEAVAAVEKSS